MYRSIIRRLTLNLIHHTGDAYVFKDETVTRDFKLDCPTFANLLEYGHGWVASLAAPTGLRHFTLERDTRLCLI